MNYFYIIFLFFFFNFVYCQVLVTNITPLTTSTIAYAGDNSKCNFKPFYILVIGSNTYSYTIDVATAGTILKNDSSMVIELNAYDIEVGNKTINFNNVITIDISCIKFDYSLISIKRLDSYMSPFLQTVSASFNIVFELIADSSIDYGALNSLPFDKAYCYGITCKLEFDNIRYFKLQIFMTQDIGDFIDKSFIVNIDNHYFTFDPFLTSSFDQVSEVMIFPYLLTNYNTSGYGETAVVQFKTNNTLFKSSYISKFPSSTQFQYYPIFGDENSTTFLFTLPVYDQPLTCDLYFQNGESFNLYQQITGSINSYKIQPLTSSFEIVNNDLVPSVPLVELVFSLDTEYYFDSVIIGVHQSFTKFKFPYGFEKKTSSLGNFKYKVSTLVKTISGDQNLIYLSSPIESSAGITYPNRGGTYSEVNIPKIINIESVHLFGDKWLLKIHASFVYSFGEISLASKIYGIDSKVATSDIYEVVKDTYGSIYLTDNYDGSVEITDGSLLSGLGLGTFFKDPRLLNYNEFDVYSIQNVSFLYNNLNVTNRRHYNVLYFNYTDIPRDSVIYMDVLDAALNQNILQDVDEKIRNEKFYAVYDYILQLFKIEFYCDPNTQYGEFQFQLIVGDIYSIHSSAIVEKLLIKTTQMDLQGPIIMGYSSHAPLLISASNLNGTALFTLTIRDNINGFDWGYIVIRSTVDQSYYNFTFSAKDVQDGGDLYNGDYIFKINVSYPCISQKLIVTDIVLYDRVKRISVYSTYVDNPLYSGVLNPLIFYVGSVESIKTGVTCVKSPDSTISLDSTEPILVSINASTYSIDSSVPQIIEFNVIAKDLESGLKMDQAPIIYLSTTYNKVLECKTNVVEFEGTVDKPSQFGKYNCSIEIPIGFGNGNGIILSVYGFINNNGLYSGFSTTYLMQNAHNYFISSTYQNSGTVLFTSHYRINEKGGDLWVRGRNLNLKYQVTVEYDDGTKQLISPDISHFTILRLPGVLPTRKKYKIYTTNSNIFTITPTIYDYYLNSDEVPPSPSASSDSTTSSSSDSTTSSSSNEPLPTNSPQQCLGSLVCGGPSNGKCIPNQGCVCYSPWIGLDCLSQVIIIDQPTTNDTSPSTNITLPIKNNNTATITYKSLITLVSIREINIYGKEVYSKSFERWEFKVIDNTTFIYNTTLNINKNNKESTINIKATLKWYINETTITFANEEILMNPSTMKYQIEINNYPFDNSLNQLQLIMSASIQSNSTDNICSLREYGETTSGDNSNYLKIQVDNLSLYGRFIRRGIVDSTITTITNTLLDKEMNSITTTKEIQSFIAIQIPNYKDSVIIDPDFSIILDSNSASSKSGSICSNKSKLSGAKIAGIVIGSVAFVAVVVISVSYHLIKKKKKAQFVKNVNQKMKNMNNDKL